MRNKLTSTNYQNKQKNGQIYLIRMCNRCRYLQKASNLDKQIRCSVETIDVAGIQKESKIQNYNIKKGGSVKMNEQGDSVICFIFIINLF